MCELFGYSGSAPGRLNDLLTEFFSHSCAHPDGWGLAVPDGGHMEIEKEPLQASRSEYLRERLREPVISALLLAHIRYATIGNVERRNCHPFTGFDNTGRQWTLVHNGTIFDYPSIYFFPAERRYGQRTDPPVYSGSGQYGNSQERQTTDRSGTFRPSGPADGLFVRGK